MTSITSNVTSIPQASPSTNSSAPSSSTHARTPSVSGQTSSSAAVQASAPAQRQLSYATAASKKPLSTPVIAASPSPHVPVGASAQNARPSAPPAVNGKMPPAVANSGPSAANGISTTFPGGHHSRKSSVASGAGGPMMPNGASRGVPPITFGAINEPGPGPALSGSAAAASNPSLTAPVASNQRASSPQSSPSPVVQPMATGGAPSGQATAASSRIQFGDTTHHVSCNLESYINFRAYLT